MISRRLVIVSGLAAAGGAFGVGYALMPFSTMDRARRLLDKADASMLARWVRIGTDNSVTVIVPHAEMGQGVHTSLPMMLAEELDADWSLVSVMQAPADVAFANGPLARGLNQGSKPFPAWYADFHYRKYAEQTNIQETAGGASVRLTGRLGMRRTLRRQAVWVPKLQIQSIWDKEYIGMKLGGGGL